MFYSMASATAEVPMLWDQLAENSAQTRDTALFGADTVTARTFDTP